MGEDREMTEIYLGNPPENIEKQLGEEASVTEWYVYDEDNCEVPHFTKKLAASRSFTLPGNSSGFYSSVSSRFLPYLERI